MKRKIISIDETKCTGCGQCIPDCPEGALHIIEGKARLVYAMHQKVVSPGNECIRTL